MSSGPPGAAATGEAVQAALAPRDPSLAPRRGCPHSDSSKCGFLPSARSSNQATPVPLGSSCPREVPPLCSPGQKHSLPRTSCHRPRCWPKVCASSPLGLSPGSCQSLLQRGPNGPQLLLNWAAEVPGSSAGSPGCHGDLAERLLPQRLLLQAAEPRAAEATPATGQCAQPGKHGWRGPRGIQQPRGHPGVARAAGWPTPAPVRG